MPDYTLTEVGLHNLADEHICCALGGTPVARRCTDAKKAWMADRFAEGYHFVKLNERGKVFIEYTPGERAWCPVQAAGWLFIDCLWVSGRFKGQGIANLLLQNAVDFAKANGYKGLCGVSSDKKRPFLSDPGFYAHKGFVMADEAPPYYRLYALPLADDAGLPQFAAAAHAPVQPATGFVIYTSDHCPHMSEYVPLLAARLGSRGAQVTVHKLASWQEAQAAPNPFPTFALYHKGQFVTNELYTEAKADKLLDSLEAQQG